MNLKRKRTKRTRRIRRKRKKRKKSLRDILHSKLEKLQRLIVIQRDKKCVLQGKIQHHCTDILQADHLISRRNKSVFFDIENLNCVCSTMNRLKQWDQRIFWELAKITNGRYGDGTVNRLIIKSKMIYNFDPEALEEKIIEYERALSKV